MKSPINLLSAARAEFDESANWYDKKSAGRGTLFTRAIDQILDRISEQPTFYPIARKNVRQAIVPKYPFCIYYEDFGTPAILRFGRIEVEMLCPSATSSDNSSIMAA